MAAPAPSPVVAAAPVVAATAAGGQHGCARYTDGSGLACRRPDLASAPSASSLDFVLDGMTIAKPSSSPRTGAGPAFVAAPAAAVVPEVAQPVALGSGKKSLEQDLAELEASLKRQRRRVSSRNRRWTSPASRLRRRPTSVRSARRSSGNARLSFDAGRRASLTRRRRSLTVSGTMPRPSLTLPAPMKRWAIAGVPAKSCVKSFTTVTRRRPKRSQCWPNWAANPTGKPRTESHGTTPARHSALGAGLSIAARTSAAGSASGRAAKSVQRALELALSQIAQTETTVIAAGRTDTGVHASLQVVHFDTTVAREPTAWVRGGNQFLPDDVAIRWAAPVDEQFHARFAARSRRYVYLLTSAPQRRAACRPRRLDALAARSRAHRGSAACAVRARTTSRVFAPPNARPSRRSRPSIRPSCSSAARCCASIFMPTPSCIT